MENVAHRSATETYGAEAGLIKRLTSFGWQAEQVPALRLPSGICASSLRFRSVVQPDRTEYDQQHGGQDGDGAE